jgi:hypothetical protein
LLLLFISFQELFAKGIEFTVSPPIVPFRETIVADASVRAVEDISHHYLCGLQLGNGTQLRLIRNISRLSDRISQFSRSIMEKEGKYSI